MTVAPPAGVTAREIEEDNTLIPALLRTYYHQVWSTLTPKARAQHAWTEYASSMQANCAFIEFTAEKGHGINRYVWDLTNDRFYISLHYNWVEGYNPFFEVTGLGPAY